MTRNVESFTIEHLPIEPATPLMLCIIKDRLILRHRRHEDFEVSKEGTVICDQCALFAEPAERGYHVLDGLREYYITGVTGDLSTDKHYAREGVL